MPSGLRFDAERLCHLLARREEHFAATEVDSVFNAGLGQLPSLSSSSSHLVHIALVLLVVVLCSRPGLDIWYGRTCRSRSWGCDVVIRGWLNTAVKGIGSVEAPDSGHPIGVWLEQHQLG